MLKKILTPVIITLLLAVFLAVYAAVWFFISPVWYVKAIVAVIFLYLIGVAVRVLIERIKEISGGEEDDLGKY